MGFLLRIHKNALEEIGQFEVEHQREIIAELKAIAQMNRASDRGRLLWYGPINGFNFRVYECKLFRLECAVSPYRGAKVAVSVTVLRVRFRGYKLLCNGVTINGFDPRRPTLGLEAEKTEETG